MAGELQISYQAASTIYFLIRSRTGTIWNVSGAAFEAYATGSYTSYVVSATEQGTASGFYVASFPAAITAGIYSIVAKKQAGGSAAESDATIGSGDFQWSGTATLPLSDLVTSGLFSQSLPVRLTKGEMVQNFLIYLKSSADHITPLTSGVVSGQIARNNGSFGALQSGAFTEVGLGFYRLQALTSGDLNANTVALLFTATQVSGGPSDPLPMTLVLQRSSGGQ